MGLPLNTQTLQLVDRWIGVPVCLVLSLLRKIGGGTRPAEAGAVAQPRKILFVKFAEQGSTVLAYPAIARAIEMVGRENIYFIVFEENRFILDVMDLIPRENVITIRHRGIFDMAVQAIQALREVRRIGIDSAVDLEFFSRSSAALTLLTGARSRVGFHTFFGEGPYRGDLMTHRLLYNPYLHTSQIFQLMIEALEQPPQALPTYNAQPPRIEKWLPEFKPSAAEQETVRAILRQESAAAGSEIVEGGRILLLNPNASDLLPLRKWPTDRYVEVARRLLEHFPEAHIGLTGAPDEAESIEKVARDVNSPRCFSLAGKTTLRQLLVLYTLCELLVTNDSGPAHFASLTPISIVTLFGPETPSLFAARSPRNTPLWMGVACSPCVNAYNNRQSPCTNNICMQQITIEHVFDAACKALAARETR
jgi:ADP-heptose:LPS heptosyltransferase